MNSSRIVHRLLYHALIKMREEGHQSDDKVVFHLADLFHNTALQMEQASNQGETKSFDDVLVYLKQQAKEKGLEQWMEQHMTQLQVTDEKQDSVL